MNRQSPRLRRLLRIARRRLHGPIDADVLRLVGISPVYRVYGDCSIGLDRGVMSYVASIYRASYAWMSQPLPPFPRK